MRTRRTEPDQCCQRFRERCLCQRQSFVPYCSPNPGHCPIRRLIRHNSEIHDIISPLWRRCTPVQRVDKLRIPIGHFIAIVIGLCVSAVPIVRSYPTAVWQLDELASGVSVLVTVRVEHTIRGSSLSGSPNRTVLGRAELIVLRAFPSSALLPGQHIQLEYEQLPDGNSPMNGPDVPPLQSGSIFVVPLKPNQDLIATRGACLLTKGLEQLSPQSRIRFHFPSNQRQRESIFCRKSL